MLFYLKVLLYLEGLLILGLLLFRAGLRPGFRDVVGFKAVVLTLTPPALVLLGHSAWTVHAFLALAAAFTSRTRTELLGTYLLLLPMTPALPHNLLVGSLYLLQVNSFMALNAGALVGFVLTSGPVRRTDPGLDIAAAVLIAILTFIAARESSATNVLRGAVQNILLIAPPYLLASRSVAGAEDGRRALLHLSLAGILGAVVAIFSAVRRWDLYGTFFAATDVAQQGGSSYTALRGGMMRIGGPMVDYTAFGMFLAVVAVIHPSLRSAFRERAFPLLSGLLVVGMASTQSRGAWVSAIAGYATSQWLRGRSGRAAAGLGATILGYLLISTVLAPTSRLADTLGTAGSESSGTADYRRRLLSRGLEQVAAHPLAGQEMHRLTAQLPDLIQGQHMVDFVNTHLFIAMTAGVPAFALWMLAWLSTVLRVAARRRQGTDWARRAGILTVPAAVIVTATVALAFTSNVDRNLFWPLIALGLATPAVVQTGQRKERLHATPAAPGRVAVPI